MFDKNWDDVYNSKRMAAYPDNALIRFVAKHYYDVPDRSKVKFLDVGCGAGSSTWYLAREGFNVTGIDGSETALLRLSRRLEAEKLEAELSYIDLVEAKIQHEAFDCIIDISSLCYIPDDKIYPVMDKLYKALKPGGRIFSICPSDMCDKEPFQLDKNFECRFQPLREIVLNFSSFKNIVISPYTYTASSRMIKLWVCAGEK